MAYKTSSTTGTFRFDEVPTGKYKVFVVSRKEKTTGHRSEPVDVDLTKVSESEIHIAWKDIPAGWVSGNVLDEAGNPLPFGWVSAGPGMAAAVDPINGDYLLSGLGSERVSVIIDVPGYYSQASAVDLKNTTEGRLDFILVRRPETKILPMGEGMVFIPSETVYQIEHGYIKLQHGWIWGENISNDSLNVQAAGMKIVLTKGTFALEMSSAQKGWFYLKDGEALILTRTGQEITVLGTQMVALSDASTPIPVSYVEPVFSALHFGTESPLQNQWEPSLTAQIRDRLARSGITIVQLVTFVTYMLVQIVIVALLIGGIYSTWKHMRKL
jgi:hypothetical protein